MSTPRQFWNFHSPGRVLFGCGCVRELGRVAQRLGVSRILIVTDQNLREANVVDHVLKPLQEIGATVEVFDGGEPEPSFACAESAIEAARAFGPDCIIGLGGGSNMDLAKITATVITHGGSFQDYFEFDKVPGPVLPLICIATTSGTGSEVSHAAVLSDFANKMKLSSLSQYHRPDVAIVDPELTLTCPPKVTAHSGMDALTHAIEAYLATDFSQIALNDTGLSPYEGKHPLGQLIAQEAISLISHHLVKAYDDPLDIDARSGMALASLYAGMAFSNCGVALVHAMEYPLGGELHCSHGEGNGMLLPHVMHFNRQHRLPHLGHIADLFDLPVDDMSEIEAADAAIDAVDALRGRVGLVSRIRDLGATREQLPDFATKAFSIKRLMALTPREVTHEDVLKLYQGAF